MEDENVKREKRVWFLWLGLAWAQLDSCNLKTSINSVESILYAYPTYGLPATEVAELSWCSCILSGFLILPFKSVIVFIKSLTRVKLDNIFWYHKTLLEHNEALQSLKMLLNSSSQEIKDELHQIWSSSDSSEKDVQSMWIAINTTEQELTLKVCKYTVYVDAWYQLITILSTTTNFVQQGVGFSPNEGTTK